MPGVFQLALAEVADEAQRAHELGLQAVLLFGIPREKDETASGAYAENGIVQQAVRAIKEKCPGLVVMTDVCLCEYMSHGHCGVTRVDGDHFHVLNDESVELLVKTAVSHAAAGADFVAPSDMMDGRIGAIREALDANGFQDTGIMSYAAKFASAFYGPFREAAESPPQFGDRRSYQMDSANAEEALREVALDIEEGADIVLVKPALPYLDILWRVRERFGKPTAVYHVSGEFAMVKAGVEKGYFEERAAVLEIMTSLKRARRRFDRHLLGNGTRRMDTPVTTRRGETEAHLRLKRLALLWAQANRYTACAAEVSLPQCRYRADVAAYRSRPREETVTAIFECKQALTDLRRDNCESATTRERLRSLTGRRQVLEKHLRIHYPTLRTGDSLFAEYDSHDFEAIGHHGYRRVLREFAALQNRLYGGTKFEGLVRYRCANLFF